MSTRPMPASVRDRADAAERSSDGVAQWEQNDGARFTKLWDAVDGTFVTLPDYQAVYDLKKAVLRCSACTFTTIFNGQVKTHVEQTREQAEAHKGATIMPLAGQKEPATTCSGCGGVFAARKGQGQKHLQRVLAEGNAHSGEVKEVHMRRFVLGPSDAAVIREVPLFTGGGPVASQVGESGGAPRRRKRYRRRRNGR